MLEPVRTFGSLGLPLLPLPLSGLFASPPRVATSSPNSEHLDKMHSSASSTDSNGAAFDFPIFEANGETPNAKIIEYRREKLACFEISGIDMICLPQAYEFFLKNLVGGLHTVYTKLKRLEITPLVCNVEQVRALRSLGAIQPGVNRCKLIAANDFDKLYDDCTSRPGRPAKRLATMDEWTMKQSRNDVPLDSVQNNATTSGNAGMLLGQFLPFSHQLLVQQMMAVAAAQQHSEPSRHQLRTDEVDVEEDGGQSLSTDSAPLNLTKNENQNSETSDNDSLENMRKDEDAQMSERGASSGSAGSGGSSAVSTTNSSNQSVSVEESSLALRKIISLVDMANEHFKAQRELLAKEREDLNAMRVRLREVEDSEEMMKTKLEAERKKARAYFNRFCKAQKEALSLKEQLIQANRPSLDENILFDVSHDSTDSSQPQI
ncbi:unnamed protein product, partial [Mesorhabditis belari]|uniref:SKI/SNO/DAC domain-containing protein n=1 Tax=Mesorhabditis belari TaxID=2138241 RepID=A0AAF3J1U5_9BILA